MKVIVAFVLLMLIGPSLSYGQAFSYREKSDSTNNYEKGEVSIDIAETTLHQNKDYTIRYTFQAHDSYAVYNWQFARLKALPGQLVIYDENKNYIGDLISWRSGSRGGPAYNDWTFLYSPSFVGTSLLFRAGYVPSVSRNYHVPKGTYYIQLVLYRAFLSSNPFLTLGKPRDFYTKNFITHSTGLSYAALM